jgi:hypothetical protein
MSEKRELNLLNLSELPRESPRRRRRRRRPRRRVVRIAVVVTLLVTGITALLVTGIITYPTSTDRLRGTNSGSPTAASTWPAEGVGAEAS